MIVCGGRVKRGNGGENSWSSSSRVCSWSTAGQEFPLAFGVPFPPSLCSFLQAVDKFPPYKSVTWAGTNGLKGKEPGLHGRHGCRRSNRPWVPRQWDQRSPPSGDCRWEPNGGTIAPEHICCQRPALRLGPLCPPLTNVFWVTSDSHEGTSLFSFHSQPILCFWPLGHLVIRLV